MMNDARRQFPAGANSQAAATLAAGLLILLGIVFQLAELGYARYAQLDATNLWFVHMLVENAWSLLAARLNLPSLADLIHFWPLLLVASGVGTLALARRVNGHTKASN
jgi:hypothetical protein